jgi:predicted amidohydrolase
VATAIATGMWVIRVDVTGRTTDLRSSCSSSIVDPKRTAVRSAAAWREDLIAAAIDGAARPRNSAVPA